MGQDISNEAKMINPNYFSKVIWKSGMCHIVCRHCRVEMPMGGYVDFPHQWFCYLSPTGGRKQLAPAPAEREPTPVKLGKEREQIVI